MRKLVVILLSAGTFCAHGGETAFPWDELKDLYRATIARELGEARAAIDAKPVVSLDEARYRLHLLPDRVEGEVALAGKLVSGIPEPIPLFGPDLVLRETGEVSGATLLPGAEGGGLQLLPEPAAESFRILGSFVARASEEGGAQVLTLAIPHAVKNRVQLKLDSGLRLLEAPGIPGPEGDYFIASSGSLQVRYASASSALEEQAPEVDLFTRIIVSQRRVMMETHGVPVRALPETALLRLPEGAQLLSTSLKPSEFVPQNSGTYAISAGPGVRPPFLVESAIDLPEDGAAISFTLPAIEGNAGKEGRFVVVEPDDGQVQVQGENLIPNLPVAQLGEGVPIAGAPHFMRIPSGIPVTLTVTRFTAQDLMDIVLESQTLHVSFDETGRSLSTLRLELPSDAGPRLVLDPVPDSEIWSLTVNGAPKQVYTDASGAWVVPLDAGQNSVVELAFLREGEPVGLHGALQVDVPQTGLGARMLYVGVGLPGRVELVSVDGPVNTTVTGGAGIPEAVAGAPYVFTQPFYKGGGMRIAVSYKEPVNTTN